MMRRVMIIVNVPSETVSGKPFASVEVKPVKGLQVKLHLASVN